MLEKLPYFKSFNNSTYFKVVCISWTIKCWILLMLDVTMMFNTIIVLNFYFYIQAFFDLGDPVFFK